MVIDKDRWRARIIVSGPTCVGLKEKMKKKIKLFYKSVGGYSYSYRGDYHACNHPYCKRSIPDY